MRIRQRVGYVRCLVGSLCQQFMESQDRFTADILLLQDTGMVLQMCAGRYACGNAYQCIRTSDEVEFAPRVSSSFTVIRSMTCPARYILCRAA